MTEMPKGDILKIGLKPSGGLALWGSQLSYSALFTNISNGVKIQLVPLKAGAP